MAGNRPKPWEYNSPGKRRVETQSRRKVLVLCEDSKSSCDYFQSFAIDPERAEVQTVGTGMNTESLVREAMRRKTDAENRKQPFNEIWCVMDRDDFPSENYARAFELAKSNGVQIAWANEAFELWYLLHFHYHDTGIGRADYKRKLDAWLEAPYDKTDKYIYHAILKHQPQALKHARRLEKQWRESGERFPERKNPSTSVHKLVEFLNDLKDLGPAH